jgi:uncharacterized Zn finger protein
MSKKRYPVRTPRYAAGIRAQETRGGVRSWWAKRWLEAVEPMGIGGRLARGRNYAASGQVVSLSIEGPSVTASVVGARPDPYRVSITFRTPGEEALGKIAAALKAEPMLLARLLADDLPLEVERMFREAGTGLFPGGKIAPGRYDVTTSCSCPDYANPCKHACAVMLLLGEETARRPMTLLELRGLATEELFDED